MIFKGQRLCTSVKTKAKNVKRTYMNNKKLSLEQLKGKLSREEMRKIVGGACNFSSYFCRVICPNADGFCMNGGFIQGCFCA
jgi:natural product precursor